MTNVLNEYNELRIGDIVADTKRIVIAATQKAERVEGDSYAYWVAICRKEGEYHPYAVWNVIARPEGFIAEQGDYCFTISEAIEVYAQRGGEI
jgi:predicted aminopeptidase